ncbi:MAG: recombinase family protein [Bacteroidales bacterium]|nr:recombinase family protein [Bacteroidales bacterium]
MMEKIGIYCRVSTQMQGTDRQKFDLLQHAEERKIKIPQCNIFEDVISGFIAGEERPQYSRLLDEIEKGNIKEVWYHELTRMARSSVELLSEIQKFRDRGIKLYFHKQNLTIDPNKPNDIGQQILLSVLSVCAEYEIELFAERSLSGKIQKIKTGGGVTADSHAYGYMVDKDGKMAINEEEAAVVKRIFQMYADGYSTFKICDALNAESISTSYTTRLARSKERRERKDLPPKIYKNFASVDDFKWIPSVITKILNKKLYCGHRHVVFHKPVVNKEKRKEMQEKGEKPDVVYTYDLTLDYLRIVDDDLFQRVQERLLQAPYNKNNTTKHDNLLTHKIRCGECGSNFSVGKGSIAIGGISGERTYRCYGRINRSDKPAICTSGAEVRQWRLDGLVVHLSITQFAKQNIETNINQQVEIRQKQLSEIESIISDKEKQLTEIHDKYKRQLKRLSLLEDETADEVLREEKSRHDDETYRINKEISKYKKDAAEHRSRIAVLNTLSKQVNIYQRIDDIWRNKTLIKAMVDDFIERVTLYKVESKWYLVVINYVNGSEFWGTIKNARYKNSEMFYDELLCKHGIELQTWVINNEEKCFTYNKEAKTVSYNGKSEIYTDIDAGEYDYEAFNKILTDKGWIGSYPLYDFDNGEDTPIPELTEPDRW